MISLRWSAVAVASLLFALPALADDVLVYPREGQSDDQMRRDEFECHEWAMDETGFDPTEPAPEEPDEITETTTSVGKGAGRGAAIGAAAGMIGRNEPVKGAAKGALVGGMVGGLRRQHQEKKQDEDLEDSEDYLDYMDDRDQYERAMSMCLESRGYAVSM